MYSTCTLLFTYMYINLSEDIHMRPVRTCTYSHTACTGLEQWSKKTVMLVQITPGGAHFLFEKERK